MDQFIQYTPTEVVFGNETENQAGAEVKKWGGTKVLVVYGGGSAKRSGLLDRVEASLAKEGLAFEELGGVKPNPRLALAEEGVKKAVEMAKEYAPFVRKIEIETENLEMVKEAVEAGADIIMLDNMTPEVMKEAVKLIDGRAETECSGNVTKENIERLVEVGVDYISSGALTHSSPILDLSLKNLHEV